MRTVATLIARGGSKRLPGKNLRPFCGLPLIAWSIIQAKCSALVDEVWMSTDDDEIEAVSLEYGARVIRYPEDRTRTPDELSGGLPPTRHMIRTILADTGDFDCWIGMLPTTPIRTPDQLDRLAVAYYEACDDEVVVGQAIPQRETVLYEALSDSMRLSVFDKSYRYLTEVGGTGAQHPRAFLRTTDEMSRIDREIDAQMGAMAREGTGPTKQYIELAVWQRADVDTLAEFELAEVLMEHYILRGRGPEIYEEYRSKA